MGEDRRGAWYLAELPLPLPEVGREVTGREVATPRNAVKLADGTYLIRSGCCKPTTCAPAAGFRCCRSARCACDWPSIHWVTHPDQPKPYRWVKPASIAAGATAGVGACIGGAAVVMANTAAVLIGVGVAGTVIGLGAITRARYRRTVVNNITINN